ncbi:hypothetical protein AWC38_SpisGene11044 [Stylophora pistillata]|uniref:Kazal-like domain-containing protein n=1 Tax=Stylophora pistillata TaxID=50429 RepID=A0A2B4S368_STYPI|nr:hypothetical protein AWC38_SpisGene11044 [Stylophora pistillata]
MDLLNICLTSTYFQYNGKHYKQLHGTAMGSPVSVVIAEIVMQNIEERALSTCRQTIPLWLRYVDDTFTAVRHDEIDAFHNHLNEQNTDIQFTREVEENGKLPFLDCLVSHNDNSLRTTVYRKPTHTDRLLDESSYNPTSHKATTIRTLTRRAQLVCDSTDSLSDENKYLHRVFTKNNYNNDFIRRNTHRPTTTTETNDTATPTTTATIPYIKGMSENISRILLPFNIRVAHKPITTLRQLLTNVKDKDEPRNRQGTIYKINCSDCQASYIGETGRNLTTRLTEHRRATRKDQTSCEAQIEKGLAKLRWSMSRQTTSKQDGEEEEGGERERERVWPADLETKVINLQYLRPTDLPFNRRVCFPNALQNENEIEMQHLKGRLLRTTKEYIADQRVGSTGNNLTTEEQQGLKSLRANKDIVVYQTDKKDHKNADDPSIGPPVRPVCGAVSAYNRKLSHLMSFILAEVWREEMSVCWNTEEMLADFKELNDSQVTEDDVCSQPYTAPIKLETEGGPIGLELTGVLAQLFMVWWDRQMVKKLEENGVGLRAYKRYVDDINVVMNASAAGIRFEEGSFSQDENLEQNLKPDNRCMQLFQSIGNSIHPSIRLEVDYPSRHVDGKLPILDLKVWIEKRRRVVSKRSSTVALAAYNLLVELDANGEKPLYRPREWRPFERARERKKRRDNWFFKGDYDTVIFVPATPGSQIKRRYMREMKATEFKIKVVEQSGTTLKAMLQKSDPFKQRRCTNADCLLCRTDGKGTCRSTGITYQSVCSACKSKYVGETSRIAYTSGREHFHALERREESSVLWT